MRIPDVLPGAALVETDHDWTERVVRSPLTVHIQHFGAASAEGGLFLRTMLLVAKNSVLKDRVLFAVSNCGRAVTLDVCVDRPRSIRRGETIITVRSSIAARAALPPPLISSADLLVRLPRPVQVACRCALRLARRALRRHFIPSRRLDHRPSRLPESTFGTR
jgi:hypothetical protein